METLRATIVYIIDEIKQEVWMAKKARKVGTGYYFGYGGKIEEWQTPDENVVEETKDESGGMEIFADKLERIALIDFYKGDIKPKVPTFRVLCYRTFDFTGSPTTTEEMTDPKPFAIEDILLEKMKENPLFKPGDELFVPQIIAGKLIKGWIHFSDDSSEVLGYEISPCTIEDLVI